MKKMTKKKLCTIAAFALIIIAFVIFPNALAGQSARADNSVDIDITNWDDWYVYDHYDVTDGGYEPWAPTPLNEKRPYFEIVENQAVNNGSITTIKELLNSGAWRNVHHLKEHISLIDNDNGGADIVFMGYGEYAYTDFLLYPETSGGEKSFGYDVYALNIDTHTLSSAGFFINAGIDESGNIHGYVLLIGFPESYGGGSFDGARMYLYKIRDGVKAEDIHDNMNVMAFTNKGISQNLLPEMELAIDGRSIVLIDKDGDGTPEYLGFRHTASASDIAVAVIFDENGNTIAQTIVDNEDVKIDEDGYMTFYDNVPLHLEDSRVGSMIMPMEINIEDPDVTLLSATVVIEDVPSVTIDNNQYLFSRDGVYEKSATLVDPGDEMYWVGRPGRWYAASFVVGESKVTSNGVEYVLDNDNAYIESGTLFIKEEINISEYESFWNDSFTIVSGSVVLLNAPPVAFDPDTMWIESISAFGNTLCWLKPTGVISTYALNEEHNYFTHDTLVDLHYGNDYAGIEAGLYELNGTDAYMENGSLYVKKNILYKTTYIDGTNTYVNDGSRFKTQNGQIYKTDGANIKFENGNLRVSGERYAYQQHPWSEHTFPTAAEVHLTNNQVLPDGNYSLGTDMDWADGYFYTDVHIFVIDGEDMYIANGKDIYVGTVDSKDYLFIFPDGINTKNSNRVEIDYGISNAYIYETIALDGSDNYLLPGNTLVHLAPRSDRYYYNSEILEHVGTLTNPGEFFAPEGKRTSLLHFNVTFTDNDFAITSSIPGLQGANVVTARFGEKELLLSDNNGQWRGFGPYVEYQSHGCSSLTSFRFSNIIMGAVPQHLVILDRNAEDAVDGDITHIEVDEGAIIGTLPSSSPDIPTRYGYEFVGWSKTSYSTVADYDGTTETMGLNDITLYAVWTAKEIDVKFYDCFDGPAELYEVGTDANANKHFGEKLTNFNSPAHDGYIFTGWYLDRDGSGEPWDFASVIDDDELVLYAGWELIDSLTNDYIVILFDSNGGTSGTMTERVSKKETYVGYLPSAATGDAPTKDGYDFIGWATEDSATITQETEWNDPSLLFVVDSEGRNTITAYAVWAKKPTVTLDMNDGNSGPEYLAGEADNGKYTITSAPPTRAGFEFIGWNTDPDGNGTSYMPGTTVEDIVADLTLYAQWKPIYTVTVTGSGAGTPGNGDFHPDDTVTISAGSKPGFKFIGWTVSTSGSPVVFANESSAVTSFVMPEGDVEVVALWSETSITYPAEEYLVLLNANDGHLGLVPSSLLTEGILMLPTETPYRTGYKFTGWNTHMNGTGIQYQPGTTISGIDSDITLYAQWEEVESYSVTYDPQNGTGPVTVVVEAGGTLARPSNPTWSGHTFLGWYYGTAPNEQLWIFTDPVNSDLLLTAKWNLEVNNPQNPGQTQQPAGDTGDEGQLPTGTPATPPSNTPEQGTTDVGLTTTPLEEEPEELLEYEASHGLNMQADIPDNIHLPEGTRLEDYNEVDLYGRQPDGTTPGGSDHSAPPNMNSAENFLLAQLDDDGHVFFMEFNDPASPPLGFWMWDDETDLWVFVDYLPPLAELPKTGAAAFPWLLMAASLTFLCAGAILDRRTRRAQ
ncbi:MAG: InlB B-repeat-containing protein [Oscillospiraceae bacterium]|nr:InlB B-repeat-containing protein [Oscillospiraceae bacterium]